MADDQIDGRQENDCPSDINPPEEAAIPSPEPPTDPSPQTFFRRVWAWVASTAKRIWRRPGVKHVVAALDRFNSRLGTQFAGSITYFSFLALIPILMVAFSVAGFVLNSRPSVLNELRNQIAGELPQGLSETVTGILDTAVDARLTVGIIGLVVALYSGISWMGNLRAAIQAMWRPDFDRNQDIAAENLFKYYWKSLKYLVFLGLAILVSIVLTAAGSWAQESFVNWWNLEDVSWLGPVFTILPIMLAVVADVLIFLWVYQVLSPKHLKPERKPLFRGAVAASLGFEILKLALTLLLPLLLTSTTARLFGQVIGLLFFFNLVATVVLFVAAWIATSPGHPSAAPPDSPASPDQQAPPQGQVTPDKRASKDKEAKPVGKLAKATRA